MQSSANKQRDMARSILPSRYRSPRKLIQKAKRSNRRHIREGLRAITHDPDPANDDWDERQDFSAYPDAEINDLVHWRRGGDKLAHFERWAVQITKDMPIDDRLSYMGSILPAGLIGDHALSHLRDLPELNPHPTWWYLHRQQWEARRKQRAKLDRYRRRKLGWAVTSAMHDGHHKAMNAVLKQQADDEPAPVLLRHTDAHAFVTDIYVRNRSGSLVHRAALLRLIAYLDTERYVVADEVEPLERQPGETFVISSS